MDNFKFRCSSLGHLMVNPKSKGELISETTKTHLIDCWISWKYDRREEIRSKFLDKGHECEEDSITLISRLKKTIYKKNDIRLSNDFITGECDLFLGEDISNADETIDTKTSWSMHSFFRAKHSELSKMYYWQGVGYMWLTGSKKHTVAYCLVNGTPTAISDEKRRLAYSLGVIDTDSNPEYKEKAKQIEINHIFDRKLFESQHPYFDFDIPANEWVYDVPMVDRLHTFEFEREEAVIEQLQKRIIDCREWMLANLK